MTARELYIWAAFDSLNPISDQRGDIRAAQIATAIYQANGAKVSLKDCLLDFGGASDTSNDEPMDIGEAFANLLNKERK